MSTEDEVLIAAQELIDGHNNADVDTLAKFWHPDCTFFTEKGILEVHRAQTREQQQALYDAGMSFQLHWEDLRVQTYENAAVTTGYMCGFSQGSREAPRKECRIRYSILWIRVDGQWKRVHAHLSPERLGSDQ